MRERPTDRPAVPDLRVSDLSRDDGHDRALHLQQRRLGYVLVPGERPDCDHVVAVDDVGSAVNPQIIDGQVHGGLTQGIAAALYEEGAYDEEGNLLTTTMATYLIPSAAEVPSYETDRTETRADNPLGVKGVGETGTIASAPAVINAVVDALSHLGVTDVGLPATPERVWKAIEAVRS